MWEKGGRITEKPDRLEFLTYQLTFCSLSAMIIKTHVTYFKINFIYRKLLLILQHKQPHLFLLVSWKIAMIFLATSVQYLENHFFLSIDATKKSLLIFLCSPFSRVFFFHSTSTDLGSSPISIYAGFFFQSLIVFSATPTPKQ